MRKNVLCTGSVLLLGAVLATAALRAEDREAGPLFSATSPRFAADLTPTLQPDGSTRMLVTVQIPYTELQFVKVPAGYGAAVDFVVVLRDPKGRHVGGDAWEERFVVRSFPESKNPNTMVSVKRRFPVEPGKYEIRIRLLDINSDRESAVEGEIEVKGLGGGSLGLAEPLFGFCRADSVTGEDQFVQNASRRYAYGLERFCVQGRIYDAAPDADSLVYRLSFKIEDSEGNEVSEEDTTLSLSPDGSFYLKPDVTRLFIGSYTLQLRVESEARRDDARARFEIEAVTVPRGEAWEVMIEALGYLVPPSSLTSLTEAKTEERREAVWRAFWQSQDPTPETERNEALLEFVRRIRYANANFRGFGPGWRTDQGRIYIQHGPPDSIEDRPMTDRSRPLQIWYYYDMRTEYVFVDRDGFGRYELLNTVRR